MTDIAIRVENLSKLYKIGKAQKRHDTLRDALTDLLPRVPRIGTNNKEKISEISEIRGEKSIGANSRQEDTIWALKDVSFEVKRGEVVGIIGRNGAGKSTLLKILSRITEPTKGRAIIDGRVGSLLEVGTGFHPELTGRENIYLNGAILGMKRAEIDRKFDEIVAFAEIDKFLDTPVKRYSSGMYVRLAFAVAAHLEPEILLVDEVLAVGDAAFQKKCLGKMGDVAKEGRTVLFVSHNLAAVSNLCNYGLLLAAGEILASGCVDSVAQRYIRSLQSSHECSLSSIADRVGNGRVRITDLRAMDKSGAELAAVHCGQDVTFELSFNANSTIDGQTVVMSIAFFNLLGQPMFLCRSDVQGTEYHNLPLRGRVRCRIPRFPLPPGEFRANVQCEINGVVADWVRDARVVTVAEGDFYGSGKLPPANRGDLLVEHYWLPVAGI